MTGWQPSLGPPPRTGDRVQQWTLGPELGSGASATVYQAQDDHGLRAALKVLDAAQILPEDHQRFQREYEAMATLDHPGVVRVYGSGIHQGHPWIALELVEGRDLEAEIEAWRTQRPEDHFQRCEALLRSLCLALHHIHLNGMVHRDLKPSNILLTTAGQPKISDFGVVKGDGTADHLTQLTLAGRLVGTVAFMAPELITGEVVDARTDLYALGSVLYLMLTFRRPIEANSVAGYLARHLTEQPRPPHEWMPDVPSRLERVCSRLLRKDRAQRFPSALAVLEALERPQDPGPLPLRGRDPLLVGWRSRLGRLREGEGGALLAVGPPGSGRTHLLEGMAEVARQAGLPTCVVSASDPDWSAVARRALGAPEGETGDEAWAVLAAQSPLVLLIDDLEDHPSQAPAVARLLRELVSVEALPVLVAFCATTPEGPLGYLANGDATGVVAEAYRLTPLDRADLQLLLRDRGLAGPLVALLARRLQDELGGWPGPAVEQFAALESDGWLRREGETLVPTQRLEAFRRCDLPVPPRVSRQQEALLVSLSPAEREQIDLLAALDRPTAPDVLLAAARAGQRAASSALARLRAAGLLIQATDDKDGPGGEPTLAIGPPYLARVARRQFTDEARRDVHGRLADVLTALRRRTQPADLAFHQEAAGRWREALETHLAAARRSRRHAGTTPAILEHTEAVLRLAEGPLGASAPPAAVAWAQLLRGEALLERREDAAAFPLLQASLAALPLEGGPEGVRVQAALGRCAARMGRSNEARTQLEAVLAQAQAPLPERALALRVLADLDAARGDLLPAQRRLEEALQIALDSRSFDGEARARRGLGHLAALRGELRQATEQFSIADQLFGSLGDHRTRPLVSLRLVQLERVAGRYPLAQQRALALIDLLRQTGQPALLLEAGTALADVAWRAGDHRLALETAQRVRPLVSPEVPATRRLRLARVFVDLGQADVARQLLPKEKDILPDPLQDVAAQRAALAARLTTDPQQAADQARWALARPPAVLTLANVAVALDAGWALLRAGEVNEARRAAKQGLSGLPTAGADGDRFELLLLLDSCLPDPRVRSTLGALHDRLVAGWPSDAQALFRQRADLAGRLQDRAPPTGT